VRTKPPIFLPDVNESPEASREDADGPRPRFDYETRTLYAGSIRIKQLTKPAQNQETVLKAFEEEGFPRRIDNPLHPDKSLGQTIYDLNQDHLVKGVIKFHGDGTTEGVYWTIYR
jgi:hypothetical protein